MERYSASMEQLMMNSRYIATPLLRQEINKQGLRDDRIAQLAGLSKSFFSKIAAQKRTVLGTDARVIAAALRVDFDLLFELPDSVESIPVGERAVA